MYKWFLILGFASAAFGANDASLALALRAQSDFDRVELAPFPDVQDTSRCAQSEAQFLPLTPPQDVALVRFRKGYCEILNAAATGSRSGFVQAAGDFANAMVAWGARGTEPMPSGLAVLSVIARLEAQPDPAVLSDIKAGLDQAIHKPACPANLMSARLCRELIDTGQLWRGWLALREEDLGAAARMFARFPGLGWNAWIAGRQALEGRRYPIAAEEFGKAVEAWKNARKYPLAGSIHILGPKPDLGEGLHELGSAQYLAGLYQAAVATLDAVVKARPEDARALFIRGLAKAAVGQPEAALQDYQLASRAAFANPGLPFAAGQAHFYRGVWLMARKNYEQAEDEFASALNFGPGPALRPDVAAWRQMAAMAAGSCASAPHLKASLGKASDFFPRRKAEALFARCGTRPDTITLSTPSAQPSM